jgi:DinB family protein
MASRMASAMADNPRVQMLLRTLQQAYERKAWHGTNLRGSLRGLSAEQAAWRPSPKRHNIWELALHAAYWKYIVLRRLRQARKTGEIRFPLPGSDWFVRPGEDASERAWKDDLGILGAMHRDLLATVDGLADADLDHAPEGSQTLLGDLILGGAFHDIYHAGQIQLLKRLHEGR